MKIAAVQSNVALANPEQNLQSLKQWTKLAAEQQAELVVFPECYLTGYCFSSREEAFEHAQPVPGTIVDQLQSIAAEYKVGLVCGLLESDGTQLFNTCLLVDETGLISKYRKIHLPFVGVDRFTDYGMQPFEVCSFRGVNIGLNICYDAAFPESSRELALVGADLIILPTNWPAGAECMAKMVVQTRAMENAVYYVACDRVGTERGTRFIGSSSILSPQGTVLAKADETAETILYAEIDPEQSRHKRVIREAGTHELHRFGDRRPDVYQQLQASQKWPSPRDYLDQKQDVETRKC